jgi:imidazole glycerol-phosphate synthase subunit HisF
MYRPRIIPILLLKGLGLVKSVKFKNPRYIGDPINAVRIFNDLKADELVFLDILATKEDRHISIDFVKKVGDEANMPFSVGGGIDSINSIKQIINAGAEKVVLNSIAVRKPEFIEEASKIYGSSTIVVCIDVKRNLFGKKRVFSIGGTKSSKIDPVSFSKMMEDRGAGEIIINSIENDGCMCGYDLELIEDISRAVSIPVVAAGGAGSINDFRAAVEHHASAVAAGSLFVYHGPRHAVLINYPDREKIGKIFR